jgi:hypothetical protein
MEKKLKLKRAIQEMAGIIFEDDTIEEMYKTITDQKIDDIINALNGKLLSLYRQKKFNESQIIIGIIRALKELKTMREEYQELNKKENKTEFDLQELEGLDNRMRQIWLLYLESR